MSGQFTEREVARCIRLTAKASEVFDDRDRAVIAAITQVINDRSQKERPPADDLRERILEAWRVTMAPTGREVQDMREYADRVLGGDKIDEDDIPF